MRSQIRMLTVLGFCMLAVDCGGGGTTTSSATDSTGESGSLDSITEVPSLDLSTIDVSETTDASGNVASRFSTKASPQFTTNSSTELSLAYCHLDKPKQVIFSTSRQVQTDRCMANVMVDAGLVTFPVDSYNVYSATIVPRAEELAEICAGIPADHVDELAACLDVTPREMLVRMGNISGVVHLNMCEDNVIKAELVFSQATANTFSGSAVRIGDMDGHAVAMSMSIDGQATLADGEIDLSADGDFVEAVLMFNGEFGKGKMTLKAINDAGTIKDIFKGYTEAAYPDPDHDNAAVSYTGLVYAEFDETGGAAQHSVTGAFEPMTLAELIPPEISAEQLLYFVQILSAYTGVVINADNFDTLRFCPNTEDSPLPMKLATNGTCDSVTKSGIESFTTATFTTAEGDVQHIGYVVDSNDFTSAVTAFDLNTLTAPDTITPIDNWDCTGSAIAIDFDSLTAAQVETLRVGTEECNSTERKVHGSDMRNHNCATQENAVHVGDVVDSGGADLGIFGGMYSRVTGGSCSSTVGASAILITPVDTSANLYCLPDLAGSGICNEFTAAANTPITVTPPGQASSEITSFYFTLDSTTGMSQNLTVNQMKNGASCNIFFIPSRPSFETEDHYSGGSAGTGAPQACIDAGLTTEAECRALCQSRTDHCEE